VTASDLLVLAPWLIFGAGLGAIGFRLFSQRRTARRNRRDTRLPRPRPHPAVRDHGSVRPTRGRRPDGRREGR
jgi:hypothetical protein